MKSFAGSLLVLSVSLLGCGPPQPRPGGQGINSFRASQGASLLTAAVAQLNDLPSAVDTKLSTPSIVLDSRKSTDKDDILAVCTANPAVPNSPFNLLVVPAKNARFRYARIRPGDIVKFYIRPDETVEQTSAMAGMGRFLPVELTVAQVIDENSLLVEESLAEAENEPRKLEISRLSDDRMVDISERLKKYSYRRLPVLGWEPSPDEKALTLIVDRLNQWSRQSKPLEDFQVDPLIKTLDNSLLKDEHLAPRISNAALSAREFKPYQGRLLQEAVWLRDISRWAAGDNFADLDKAQSLFDWTVRNIQLDADENAAAHRPWQTLLYGHGTARQRAWVFALLCRQQGLDVVLLTPTTAASASPTADAGDPSKLGESFALPALVSDAQLYVFDARLGLPFRSPDGKVATLAQLRGDDALLRQFDVLPAAPYPLTAAQLEDVTANLVADEFDLSQAAQQLERKLTADNRVVLSANAGGIAQRVKDMPGVSSVRVWDVPFTTLRDQLNRNSRDCLQEAMAFEPFAWRPTLWQARVLHFQGRRPNADTRRDPGAESTTSHAEAVTLYSRKVRPSLHSAEWASPDKQRIAQILQTDAAYWVGLLLFDLRHYDVAEDWFAHPELYQAGSQWAAGATYNRARSLEAQGKRDQAIELYESDQSPQCAGSLLRVRHLKQAEQEVH